MKVLDRQMKLLCLFLLFFANSYSQWSRNTTLNTPVCLANGSQSSSKVLAASNRNTFVVWINNRNGILKPFAQLLDVNGYNVWQLNGISACPQAVVQGSFDAVTDNLGNLFLAWSDMRNGHTQVFAQKVSEAGLALWGTNGSLVADTIQCDSRGTIVTLSADDRGGLVVAWTDCRTYSNYPNLFAQRLNSEGVIQWTLQGVQIAPVQPGSLVPTIREPRSLPDREGGAVFVWESYLNSTTANDIFGERLDSSGNELWTSDGDSICVQPYHQVEPQFVLSSDQSFIVAWRDERNGGSYTGDIYAQKVNFLGNSLWTTNGVPVCLAANGQGSPTLASDDTGGAVITWTDYRSDGSTPYIYAQQVDAQGTTLWSTNGVLVCSYPAVPAAIVRDGSHGAIVSWVDGRNGNAELFAQRLSYDGRAFWDSNGTGVCNSGGNLSDISMVESGDGGIVVTWSDDRDTLKHIFAQKVLANSTLAPTVPELIQPTDRDSGTSLTLTFLWKDVNYSTGFRIQIASDSSFIHPSLVIDSGGINATQFHDSLLFLQQGEIYYWRIKAYFGQEDSSEWSEIRKFNTLVLGISSTGKEVPRVFSLEQNYPNPFNPSTVIEYELPNKSKVRIDIYNLLGEKIRMLLDDLQESGYKVIRWNGTDNSGNSVASGIYFYRIEAISNSDPSKLFVQVKKMILIR